MDSTKNWTALEDGVGWEGKGAFLGAAIIGEMKDDGKVKYYRLCSPTGEPIKYLKNYNDAYVLETAERILLTGKYCGSVK